MPLFKTLKSSGTRNVMHVSFWVPQGAQDKQQAAPGCTQQNQKFTVRITFGMEDGR